MGSDIQHCNGYRIYNGKGSTHKKSIARVSPRFRSPLVPIPNLCTFSSSRDDRDSISVVIPIYLLGKKGAMMRKVNVDYGKTNMDKTVRRTELPCVRHSRPSYRGRVSLCEVQCRWKEKSDEEVKKK
jgi:hypothetical protein